MPSCDPGVSVRGGVPARRSAVAALAALELAAGCDDGSRSGPDLAAMTASGGTDLLLSGARRIVECDVQVGVHSWASGRWIFGLVNGDELPRDDPAHRSYLDYYRDIGIPEAFYWFTLEAAPPDSIHWMNEDEMERYRIHTHFRGPCGQGSASRAALPQTLPHRSVSPP